MSGVDVPGERSHVGRTLLGGSRRQTCGLRLGPAGQRFARRSRIRVKKPSLSTSLIHLQLGGRSHRFQ